MQYLIRLAQAHESFRQPELEALGVLAGVQFETTFYSADSPFCIISLPQVPDRVVAAPVARDLVSRSILSKGVYELWGEGDDYETLHKNIKQRTEEWWPTFENLSFKFSVDAYCGKRSSEEQRRIINSFAYLGFKGKIAMRNPDADFVVFEEWECLNPEEQAALHNGAKGEIDHVHTPSRGPKRLYLGRSVGGTRRQLSDKHDLKKRPYISTTSMDAELALVTANIALAAAGKLFLDPFVGTGGFMVAAAELGAVVLGSDIDGRSFRGKGVGLEKGISANFRKYELYDRFGDCIISDLTNTPFRSFISPKSGTTRERWLDGIICDPPYGVREGLKVLGTRRNDCPSTVELDTGSGVVSSSGPYLINGIPAYTLPGYIAPKRPYSFVRMLNDILDFAASTLVDHGRLAFWMPSANEAEEDFPTPTHRLLELRHVCTQTFNKWSRKLLVYERIHGEIEAGDASVVKQASSVGANGTARSADELNPFRKLYFQGFAEPS